MAIKILDPLIANQIAAGEVIERPASIVKECLENSLDAEADKIEVYVDGGGMRSLKIIDNGSGIAKEDLPLAVLRHGTSKIFTTADLQAIATLGFRGEALASICSVARVEINSAQTNNQHGWQLKAQGVENTLTQKPIAHPKGTSIVIEELFFNIPARRRFLRTEKTEFSRIEDIFKKIALSHFDKEFKLVHNQKTILQLAKADTDQHKDKRVLQICGKDFMEKALKIDMKATGLRLWGWVADPSYVRHQADNQYMFINGRSVKDKLINHAIKQAFAELLETDQFCSYVLFLECDPSSVDVNVHPTKHEVRFHETRLIHDFVFTSLQKVLQSDLVPTEIITETMGNSSQEISFAGPNDYKSDYKKPLQFQDVQEAYQGLYQRGLETDINQIQKMTDDFGTVIGIVTNQILLTLSERGLGLLDLIKTKKILLESFLKNQSFVSKPLLFPLTLTFSESALEAILQHKDYFLSVGFDLEALGTKQMVLRQVPDFFEDIEMETFFQCISEYKGSVLKEDLASIAAKCLKPITNKLTQEKLLKTISKKFTLQQVQQVFRNLNPTELEKLI